MKRLFATVLAFALLLVGGSALAEYRIGDEIEVVNCKEWITLRDEPSTSADGLAHLPLGATATVLWDNGGDFVRVSFGGECGYVLRKYVTLFAGYRGDSVELTDDQRYNVNLFLSNFTEQGFAWGGCVFVLDVSPDRTLVDFAIDHIWFNQSDKLEWGEWGDDNVRLSDQYIDSVVRKYFGRAPKNLSDTRMDYRDGYYYWQETGGHISDGFACLNNVEDIGGGLYTVYFGIFGTGMPWDNDACHYSIAQAGNRYDRNGSGLAVIDVGQNGNLNDRSTWRLMRYAWNRSDLG